MPALDPNLLEYLRQTVGGTAMPAVQPAAGPVPVPPMPRDTGAEIDAAMAADRETTTRRDNQAGMLGAAKAFNLHRPVVQAPEGPEPDALRAWMLKRQTGQQDQAHELAQQKARLDAVKTGADIYKTGAEVGKITAETGKVTEETGGLRRKNEPATPALRDFAGKLGIAVPETATNDELRAMVDPFLKKAGINLDWAKLDVERSKAGQGKAQSVQNLRQEFLGRPEVKDAGTVSTAYRKILAATPTGAGDMGLVYGYMKLLDPGSTVREGEYANAANAGSAFDKVGLLYNRVLKGEKLPDTVRQQFKTEAGRIYEAQLGRYKPVEAEYRRLAEQGGFNPADVVINTGLNPAEFAGGAAGGPVKITGDADYAALPAGTVYIDPEGNQRTKR